MCQGGHVHLSITHLSTFVAVVQYGSMTTAAVSLTYSLSTVSGHVTSLERQLRTRLLCRQADGCVPTVAGRAVADRAAALLELHDSLVSSTQLVDPRADDGAAAAPPAPAGQDAADAPSGAPAGRTGAPTSGPVPA